MAKQAGGGLLNTISSIDTGAVNLVTGGVDPQTAANTGRAIAKVQSKTPVVGPVLQAASGGLSGIWQSIVKDAKYAALLVAALLLGALMIFHGAKGTGGSSRPVIFPVPA